MSSSRCTGLNLHPFGLESAGFVLDEESTMLANKDESHAVIRVNNVAPGVIRTPMSDGLSVETYQAFSDHSAKRLGPEDVAIVAVWLSGRLTPVFF